MPHRLGMAIPALRRQKQEDQKFKVILIHVVNLRPARATCINPCLREEENTKVKSSLHRASSHAPTMSRNCVYIEVEPAQLYRGIWREVWM